MRPLQRAFGIECGRCGAGGDSTVSSPRDAALLPGGMHINKTVRGRVWFTGQTPQERDEVRTVQRAAGVEGGRDVPVVISL